MLSGFGVTLSLIVAIGAQNAFLLRQGLRREHVGVLVVVCVISDAIIISGSVAGAAALIAAHPAALDVLRIGGSAFLLTYAVLAARRAMRSRERLLADAAGAPRPLGSTVLLCLAFTWLNPHTYIDTMLIGTVAGGHGDARWWFCAGAVAGSVVWFTSLGFGAARLRPLFSRPVSWRVLDGVIAAVMTALGVGLVVGT